MTMRLGPVFQFMRRRRRAALLVMTLWIALVLSVMAFSLAYEMRLNLRLASQNERVVHARALARAGMAKAVNDLRNDRILTVADPGAGRADTRRDVWAMTADKTEVEYGGGTYTVRVEDEESKINLNALNVRNAPILGHIIATLTGMDAYDANQVAFMIVDYQDPDSLPCSGSGTSESEHWTEVCRDEFGDDLPEDYEFRPRNEAILTLDELLQIHPITRELLYGDPRDEAQRRGDPRRRGRGGRKRGRADEEDPDEISTILSDYITVQSERYLNINTASPLVVEALLAAVLPVPIEAAGLAERFADYRRSLGRSDDLRGIMDVTKQLQEAGIPQQELEKMREFIRIDVSSLNFVITSKGTWKGVSKTLRAKVKVTPDVFQVDPRSKDAEGRRDPDARAELREKQQFIIDPAVRVIEMNEL